MSLVYPFYAGGGYFWRGGVINLKFSPLLPITPLILYRCIRYLTFLGGKSNFSPLTPYFTLVLPPKLTPNTISFLIVNFWELNLKLLLYPHDPPSPYKSYIVLPPTKLLPEFRSFSGVTFER